MANSELRIANAEMNARKPLKLIRRACVLGEGRNTEADYGKDGTEERRCLSSEQARGQYRESKHT